MALVAEKTGYPVDMLDLDLDLEADLGIDTVKQAEVMATIREATASPATTESSCAISPRSLTSSSSCTSVHRNFAPRRPQQLRPLYPNLRPKRNESRARDQVAPPVAAVAPAPAKVAETERFRERPHPCADGREDRLPKDMLDLDLDLEADLGVDTVKQAEMFAAIREIYNIPRDENRKLREYPTLAHVIRFVYEKRPDLASACSNSSAQSRSSQRRADPCPSPRRRSPRAKCR